MITRSIQSCALDCGTLRDLLAPARRKKSGMCWQQLRNIYQTHDLHEVILTLEMYARWIDLSTVVVAVKKKLKGQKVLYFPCHELRSLFPERVRTVLSHCSLISLFDGNKLECLRV